MTLSRLKLSSGFGTIRYILLCSSRGGGVERRGDEREDEWKRWMNGGQRGGRRWEEWTEENKRVT